MLEQFQSSDSIGWSWERWGCAQIYIGLTLHRDNQQDCSTPQNDQAVQSSVWPLYTFCIILSVFISTKYIAHMNLENINTWTGCIMNVAINWKNQSNSDFARYWYVNSNIHTGEVAWNNRVSSLDKILKITLLPWQIGHLLEFVCSMGWICIIISSNKLLATFYLPLSSKTRLWLWICLPLEDITSLLT